MEKWKVSQGGAFVFSEAAVAICSGFYDPERELLFGNWETNRHIIAAAPEMFEALEQIAKLYHYDRTCSLEAQGYSQQECNQIGIDDLAAQIARAALAKAKGGGNG